MSKLLIADHIARMDYSSLLKRQRTNHEMQIGKVLISLSWLALANIKTALMFSFGVEAEENGLQIFLRLVAIYATILVYGFKNSEKDFLD